MWFKCNYCLALFWENESDEGDFPSIVRCPVCGRWFPATQIIISEEEAESIMLDEAARTFGVEIKENEK